MYYYENLAKIYGDRGYKFMNPIYGKNRTRKQIKLS